MSLSHLRRKEAPVILRSGRSQLRSTVVALAVAALAATGTAAVVATTTTAQAAAPPPVSVEDEGAGCAVSLPGSSPATSRLPDPFKRIDGTRISAKADWRCR